jgi:PAS domain-containing protein
MDGTEMMPYRYSPVESRSPAWDEADRIAALRGLGILDTEPENGVDNLAKVAAHVCDAPVALVSLIDEQRQWFKCEIGLGGVRETPRDIAICAHAILQTGLFIVPDATKDPRFSGNPLVKGDTHLRFYAGAPLVTDEGLPLGTLCVIDRKPRPEGLSQPQADALLALASAVMSQIKLRQANNITAESERRFRMIAEAMPQIVWSAQPDGCPDYCNERWYEFTGLPRTSGVTHAWNDLVADLFSCHREILNSGVGALGALHGAFGNLRGLRHLARNLTDRDGQLLRRGSDGLHVGRGLLRCR